MKDADVELQTQKESPDRTECFEFSTLFDLKVLDCGEPSAQIDAMSDCSVPSDSPRVIAQHQPPDSPKDHIVFDVSYQGTAVLCSTTIWQNTAGVFDGHHIIFQYGITYDDIIRYHKKP